MLKALNGQHRIQHVEGFLNSKKQENISPPSNLSSFSHSTIITSEELYNKIKSVCFQKVQFKHCIVLLLTHE